MKRAVVRAMYGQKVVDRKTIKEQMDILGLKDTVDELYGIDQGYSTNFNEGPVGEV